MIYFINLQYNNKETKEERSGDGKGKRERILE
jgi:hypothetical protein